MRVVHGASLGAAHGHDPRRFSVGQGPQLRPNRPSPAYTSSTAMSFGGPARTAGIGPRVSIGSLSTAVARYDRCLRRADIRPISPTIARGAATRVMTGAPPMRPTALPR